MNLKSLLFAGTLVSAALFASCSSDDNDGIRFGKGGIQFNAKINGPSSVSGNVSRATETSWEDGDNIGIFSENDGESGFAASNVQYTATAAGALTPKGDGINYKDASTKTNFKAYYPYSDAASTGTVAVNVTDQSNQAKLDLLYASVSGKTSADQNVTLNFDHQLVKVVFNVTAGTGVSLDGLKTTLSGSLVSGKFDVATGLLTQEGNAQDIAFKVASGNKAAEAIILPLNSLNGTAVTFTTSDGSTGKVDLGTSLTANSAQIKSFDKGSKYTIPVTLGKKDTTPGELSVTFGKATINPWNNVVGDDITVDFGKGDTPTPGDYETVTYPYSESFSSDFGKFKVEDTKKPDELNAIWAMNTQYKYAQASAYDSSSKVNYSSESWLVSPIIDLSSATNPYLTFTQVLNYFSSLDVAKGQATVWVREAGGKWAQAQVSGYPSEMGWDAISSSVDLNAYKGKKIQIGFKYISTSDKAGTWRISGVSVDDKAQEGEKGTLSNPYSVSELIGKQDKTKAWVKAYIVGYNPQGSTFNPVFGTSGTLYDTNLIIAAKADETTIANIVPVQLPQGDVRNALNLKDNPGNLGKEVLLYGSFENYFKIPGLKSVSGAVLDGKNIGNVQ